MSSPTYTGGSAGNALASSSLAAGASTSAFTLDVSVDFEMRAQFGCTFGTMAAVAGLQINIYEYIGSTPVADTVLGVGSTTLSPVSGAQAVTVHLQTGKYRVVLTNLDASNGLTLVYATYDLTPAVA